MSAMAKSPAEIVIEKFGGHAVIAEVLGVSVSRVYRWTYPESRGGTGGLIPQKHQAPLLNAAREKQIELAPVDFFPSVDLESAPSQSPPTIEQDCAA
jgi:hypothetical protein